LEEAENERMHLLYAENFMRHQQADDQDFSDSGSTYLATSIPRPRSSRCHVQPLFLDLPNLAKNRSSIRRCSRRRSLQDLVSPSPTFQPRLTGSTHCISDIENGLVPEWSDRPAPQIAIVSHFSLLSTSGLTNRIIGDCHPPPHC
jgi:hypothetical protein